MMAVAHDATGKREPDSPAFLLGREARIEDLMPDLTRDTWAVVRDPHTHTTLGQRIRGYFHSTIAARKRIDRVLGERLKRPFEQHRIALHHEVALVRCRNGYPLRQGRHARAEVGCNSVDELAQIHRLLMRRSSDSLESVCDSLQSLEISLHMIERGTGCRFRIGLAQQLDP